MENQLIEKYNQKHSELKGIEEEIYAHFDSIVDTMLVTAKTTADYTEIKERLRIIPECAIKVLLFVKIILSESSLPTTIDESKPIKTKRSARKSKKSPEIKRGRKE